MSKVEKFIKENTKDCSNIVAYSGMIEGSEFRYHEWLTPDQAKEAVEIARKEVIEKVCSFIDDNMAEYIDIRGYTGNTFIDVESDRFINDLKQAMNDE